MNVTPVVVVDAQTSQAELFWMRIPRLSVVIIHRHNTGSRYDDVSSILYNTTGKCLNV